MATRIVKNFRPVSALMGDAPLRTITLLEGASQTFAVGDPLTASGGYAVVHTGSTLATILGFAAAPASGTTAAAIKVWPALPNVLYEGSLVATATTSHTLVVTNYHVAYGLVLYTADTPNVWAIDVSETTDPLFKIVKPGKGDAGDAECVLGDVNARVQFTIPPNCCQIMSLDAMLP